MCRLGTQSCHCSSLGHCCGLGSIPGPRTYTCCCCGKEREEEEGEREGGRKGGRERGRKEGKRKEGGEKEGRKEGRENPMERYITPTFLSPPILPSPYHQWKHYASHPSFQPKTIAHFDLTLSFHLCMSACNACSLH